MNNSTTTTTAKLITVPTGFVIAWPSLEEFEDWAMAHGITDYEDFTKLRETATIFPDGSVSLQLR